MSISISKIRQLALITLVSFSILVPLILISKAQAASVPVAAYNFNEASGSTLTDLSGNGNHGTISGASWSVSGKYGGALSFDGVNDLVTTADSASLDLTGGMTLEVWVKPTTLPTDWRTIILKERPGHLAYALYGNTSGNRPSVEVTTSTGNYETRGNSRLSTGTWSYLAGTYDGSSLKLYVNGSLVSSRSISGGIFVSTNPLRIGGNSVWGEYFNGLIDEVRVYNRALTQAEIQADMNTPVASDTQAPTVAITVPANNATVSGTITVAADAQDNVSVSGVQFLLDGANLGTEDTVASYAIPWDTTTSINGSHTLAARARDTSNNQTISSPISVIVSNTDPRAQVGEWGPLMSWPLVAVHGTFLNTGKVLVWDAWETGTTTARVWDPATNTFTNAYIADQLFCAGHSGLSDGKIYVTGGHNGGNVGIPDTNIFDPTTNSWTAAPNMIFARWYPTNTTIGDGRVVIFSGQITSGNFADTPEIYNPRTNTISTIAVNTSNLHDSEYPLNFLLPDGKVYAIGATPGVAGVLNVANQTWTLIVPPPSKLGSAAMYASGKILYTGGGDVKDSGQAAKTQATVIDMTQALPAWRQVSPMANPRYQHNLVVLPDGKVLAVGGVSVVSQSTNNGTLSTEIWDPSTETWTSLASISDIRGYHSIAMLLLDGRVLSAGGGRSGSQVFDHSTAQIYSPTYLFKGPRPAIISAPSTASYGTTMTVQTAEAADINSVSLVPLASVTHTIDMNQRYLALQFTKGNGELAVQTPTSPNLAPPGFYMLFIVNSNGVPSKAAIVKLNLNDNQPPSAPTTLSATAGTGSAALSWNASSDNLSVSHYNIHRSTSPSIVPSSTNKIAQATATSYTDSGLASGTYYYVVTAEDTSGNISAGSNEVSVTVQGGITGLVAAFSFNEGTGLTVNDSSGNNNNGTISGATWTTTGKYSNALSFDGTNDRVTVSDSASLDLGVSGTISGWFKLAGLNTWRSLVAKGNANSFTAHNYGIEFNTNNQFEIVLSNGSSYNYLISSTRVTDTANFHHFALTWDGSFVRLYIDGVLDSTWSQTVTPAGNSSSLYIGQWGGNVDYFDGVIDQVRIYNRVVTASEIQTDINTPI